MNIGKNTPLDLRVMAVAPPMFVTGKIGESVLKCHDPVSLFNACRQAAYLSEKIGPWSHSNWSGSRTKRRDKFLLLNSLEELPVFQDALLKERPNLLLIGAMTLCFPGAIACAKLAKDILGDEVLVVLGGRHTNETIYFGQDGQLNHHPGSPIRLMKNKTIPKVFDLVISGEGEYVIAELGNFVAQTRRGENLVKSVRTKLSEKAKQTSGKWLAAWLQDDESVLYCNNNQRFDRNALMPTTQLFGVTSGFSVFPGAKTAQVYTDTGGCIYNCHFCSESNGIVGPPTQLSTGAGRLYRQLDTAQKVIMTDWPGWKASAFIEDSILLAGQSHATYQLAEKLTTNPLDIVFGGQLTIDHVLRRKQELLALQIVGLQYLFVGLETAIPQEIGGMSKSANGRNRSWLERAEEAFAWLSQQGFGCGAAVLFGLGESRESRHLLFEQVRGWQKKYNAPRPLSINWAVQHPLRSLHGGEYTYHEWGTPGGTTFEKLFINNFGEASLEYPIQGVSPPNLDEVREVVNMYQEVNSSTTQEVEL